MVDYILPDRVEVDLHASAAQVSIRDAETQEPLLRIWNLDVHWVAGEPATATLIYYDRDKVPSPSYSREYYVSGLNGSRLSLFSEAEVVPVALVVCDESS